MTDLIIVNNKIIQHPKQMTFIYCWENILNHKRYIGQTHTGLKRLSDEKSLCHINQFFVNAVRKDGINNFICYILEYCLPSELDDIEKKGIKQYQTVESKYGYNLAIGGTQFRDIIYYNPNKDIYYYELDDIPDNEGDETYTFDVSTQQKIKPVPIYYQYSLEGMYLNRFINLYNAIPLCNSTSANARSIIDNIQKNVNHVSQSAYGYIGTTEKIVPTYNHSNYKRVAQYDLDGHLINTFINVKNAADAVQGSEKNLGCTLNDPNRYQSYGFIGEYYDIEPQKTVPSIYDRVPFVILQYDLHNNLIAKYTSITEAAEKTGISRTTISLCCSNPNRKNRYYKGEKHGNRKELE